MEEVKEGFQYPGSAQYWEERYAQGGHSGAGSLNRLAVFKAEIINKFLQEQEIQTVVEWGCGDGNQLSLMEYPQYLGLDVSPSAIARCREQFKGDSSKAFETIDEHLRVERPIKKILDASEISPSVMQKGKNFGFFIKPTRLWLVMIQQSRHVGSS